MDKIITVLAAAMLVFVAGILILEESIPWGEQQAISLPREDNGMIGRAIEAMYDLYWNPPLMFAVILAVMFSLTGVVKYWTSIED